MKKQEMPTQNNESPEISKLKWQQSVVLNSQGENDLYLFAGYNWYQKAIFPKGWKLCCFVMIFSEKILEFFLFISLKNGMINSHCWRQVINWSKQV